MDMKSRNLTSGLLLMASITMLACGLLAQDSDSEIQVQVVSTMDAIHSQTASPELNPLPLATFTRVAVDAGSLSISPTANLSLPPTPNVASFDDWLTNAKILLYEGTSGDPQRARIVSRALDGLRLPYYDAGSQIGEFQFQLSGSREWDLVIYARENRDDSAGNLFGDVFSEYDEGSSVVIEHWNLDDVINYSPAFTLIMERCGLVVTADWFDPYGNADLLLYPHNTQNPIHNQPNSNIRLTSFGTVKWTGDIGDFIRVQPENDAQVLYSAFETTETTKATVVSCFDNRFILQTFSTHQYDPDRVLMLWENYIYNSLFARYKYLGN